MAEIVAAESALWRGEQADKPFVLVAQQSLFDPTRAPSGKHTAWAYCHLPNGSSFDMADRIEGQIERFAPGFRDCVLARSVMFPKRIEERNANYVGGDINGRVQDLGRLFTRPTFRRVPYSTPAKGIYICSSSTPREAECTACADTTQPVQLFGETCRERRPQREYAATTAKIVALSRVRHFSLRSIDDYGFIGK